MTGQRDMIRRLFRQHGENEEAVVNAYAAAERAGEVPRRSNINAIPAEVYGRGLFRGTPPDGDRKTAGLIRASGIRR